MNSDQRHCLMVMAVLKRDFIAFPFRLDGALVLYLSMGIHCHTPTYMYIATLKNPRNGGKFSLTFFAPFSNQTKSNPIWRHHYSTYDTLFRAAFLSFYCSDTYIIDEHNHIYGLKMTDIYHDCQQQVTSSRAWDNPVGSTEPVSNRSIINGLLLTITLCWVFLLSNVTNVQWTW